MPIKMLLENAANNVSKHYGLNTACGSTASQVMGGVEGNFAQFGNYSRWGGLESVTFSPPAGMGPGSTIPISVSVFGLTQNLSVNVQSMNSQSMAFITNPGHLLYPASITFAASPASPGSINFNIDLGGTVANPMKFRFGGTAFEDAQWNHFLGKVGVLQGRWLVIGTNGAAVLLLVNVIFASVLGVGAGALTCLILRQPWGLKAALTDAILAIVVAVIAAYAVSAIDNARGVMESRVGVVLGIAAASVVVEHLLRRAVRSPS